MGNIELFQRINASAPTLHWQIAAALVIAQWIIRVVPLALTIAWVRSDGAARATLLEILVATLVALGIGQAITHVWPEPRRAAFGHSIPGPGPESGAPRDHVNVFWFQTLVFVAAERVSLADQRSG